MAATQKVLAWHIIKSDRTLDNDMQHVDVVPGQTVSIPDVATPSLCNEGLHASVKLVDCFKYRTSNIVCRVEVWGDIEKGDDKICGRYRKVLWMVDAEDAFEKVVEELIAGYRGKAVKKEVLSVDKLLKLINAWKLNPTRDEAPMTDLTTYLDGILQKVDELSTDMLAPDHLLDDCLEPAEKLKKHGGLIDGNERKKFNILLEKKVIEQFTKFGNS